jgi:hypothetical protein
MRIITAAVLLVSLLLGFIMSPTAVNEPTLDDKLAPYQAVIDKVNAEYDTTIYIPDENKGKVYSNMKDRSLKQVEQLLHQTLEASNQAANDTQSDTTYIKDNCILQKNDSANTTDYYLNSKDYILDSTSGKKTGLDYIPITYGTGKLVPLK